MGEAMVFTSGKGGTGKTTAVAGIASCLAASGRAVLCVDCDMGLGNLDLSLGIEGAATDLGDVLKGRMALRDAVFRHPDIPGLSYLAAPVSLAAEEIDRAAMAAVMAEAGEQYDYVLLDSPAGIGSGFRLAKELADTAVIVATWDASSLRDGQRAAALLYEGGVSQVKLLVNRLRPRYLRRARLTVDDMIDTVGAQLLGVVPEDGAVQLAAMQGMALALRGPTPAARAFLRVARRLMGEELPIGRI